MSQAEPGQVSICTLSSLPWLQAPGSLSGLQFLSLVREEPSWAHLCWGHQVGEGREEVLASLPERVTSFCRGHFIQGLQTPRAMEGI